MKRVFVITLVLVALLVSMRGPALAEPDKVDLTPRLQELFAARSLWLLTNGTPPPLAPDYHPALKTATWALNHEQGKIRYMKQWAQNRSVEFVEAKPEIEIKYLGGNAERARFYVAQSLELGYVYPGESTINRFGVGTRHIVELKRVDNRWLIGMEWYTDPLGDDTEIPDVTPALIPAPLPAPTSTSTAPAAAPGGYNREGAVTYADMYCGLATGCGNNRRYNPKYRDYNGVGGDCTNYVSQALRDGGKLNVAIHTRVSNLAGSLQYSGRGRVVAKAPFQTLWKQAAARPEGFRSQLSRGDLVAYQEKGQLEHFAIVTGFDSHGYPLINSHTADRYHVPFDMGWDRKTIYWLFQLR
ncbi:MAG TPA: amidase domain-containing protein [Symbiobacteriaceae bacterium]|jgi:hypothetical protein